MCVSEGVGGREGGRGGGPDTELKTKTPHVNVGKKDTSEFDAVEVGGIECPGTVCVAEASDEKVAGVYRVCCRRGSRCSRQ